MAIKNKDGSTYTLRGPNALMQSQARWEESVVLLNFSADDSVIVKDKTRNAAKVLRDYAYKSPMQELQEEIQAADQEVQPDPGDQVVDALLDTHSVNCLCLPVTESVEYDQVYGDPFTTRTYGKQYMIKIIIVDEGDLQMNFWTNDSLPEKTIIYPQNHQKRCWRVVSSEPQSGGFVHACHISEVNPSFDRE